MQSEDALVQKALTKVLLDRGQFEKPQMVDAYIRKLVDDANANKN